MQELSVLQINKYKKKSQPDLHKLARKYFNEFIRLRDRNGDSFTCCSCGTTHVIEGTNYHAGHFHSAGHNGAIEFDEVNVNGQGIRCNLFLHGNLIEYQKFMFKKYGQEELDRLDMKRNLPFKPSRIYYIGILEEYKQKVIDFRNQM